MFTDVKGFVTSDLDVNVEKVKMCFLFNKKKHKENHILPEL